MKVPLILDTQEPIIRWAKKKLDGHMNLCSIIKLLMLPTPSEHHEDDTEYVEAWNIYHKYNSSHKDNIIVAIAMNCYRKYNDFSENSMVTNGVLVGFAKSIDLSKREFFLCPALNKDITVGKFFMDDFSELVSK